MMPDIIRAELLSLLTSSSEIGSSKTFSTPSPPTTDGRLRLTSLIPYCHFSVEDTVSMDFSSLRIHSTMRLTAAATP